jgi:DNA-binding Lrp family transcriptional regulator
MTDKPPKITAVAQQILAMIDLAGPCSTDVLAIGLGKSRQAISNHVRRLQELQLIHHAHWIVAPYRTQGRTKDKRRRPPVWALGPMPADAPRRLPRYTHVEPPIGIEEDDLQWMKTWQERTKQRAKMRAIEWRMTSCAR